MIKDFELISHTADLQIRVYGTTLSELFVNAVIGMFQAIEPRAQGCHSEHNRVVCPALPEQQTVVVQSGDINALLVDFLSDALYLSDVHNQAYLGAKIVSLSQTTVNAELYGVMVQGFAVEIKAVTYHGLDIRKVKDLWQTDIVFDI